jgi:beta-lactamase superfamily II metal-dependent hydrolase
MVDMINKKINVALPFFESIINLLPFNNYYKNTKFDNSPSSNLKIAKIWIKHNFNKDKSSIIIGGLRLEIIAPTEMTRMLIITCAPKDWNL